MCARNYFVWIEDQVKRTTPKKSRCDTYWRTTDISISFVRPRATSHSVVCSIYLIEMAHASSVGGWYSSFLWGVSTGCCVCACVGVGRPAVLFYRKIIENGRAPPFAISVFWRPGLWLANPVTWKLTCPRGDIWPIVTDTLIDISWKFINSDARSMDHRRCHKRYANRKAQKLRITPRYGVLKQKKNLLFQIERNFFCRERRQRRNNAWVCVRERRDMIDEDGRKDGWMVIQSSSSSSAGCCCWGVTKRSTTNPSHWGLGYPRAVSFHVHSVCSWYGCEMAVPCASTLAICILLIVLASR